jgi:hypothetical protein
MIEPENAPDVARPMHGVASATIDVGSGSRAETVGTDKPTVDAELESLQRDTFRYFLLWTNPQNGLVLDKTAADWPASIAALQGPESDATGHHGFYYHFLDMQTGRRAWQCELSTVDSAILLAGAGCPGKI